MNSCLSQRYLRLSEYIEYDWNWSSALRFPIRNLYPLHHLHIQSYNTGILTRIKIHVLNCFKVEKWEVVFQRDMAVNLQAIWRFRRKYIRCQKLQHQKLIRKTQLLISVYFLMIYFWALRNPLRYKSAEYCKEPVRNSLIAYFITRHWVLNIFYDSSLYFWTVKYVAIWKPHD